MFFEGRSENSHIVRPLGINVTLNLLLQDVKRLLAGVGRYAYCPVDNI